MALPADLTSAHTSRYAKLLKFPDSRNTLHIKLPEESHTPNRIYAIFNKQGNDVQAIAKYGPDGKKIWEIHTRDHNGLGEHYHPCEDGHAKTKINKNGFPESVAYALDAEKMAILKKVRNYGR